MVSLEHANPKINRFDLLATEFSLFGDYACDLVVGGSVNRDFCLVEFEDASPQSVFVKKKGKSTPEWSPRFDRGFSQIKLLKGKLLRLEIQTASTTRDRFGRLLAFVFRQRDSLLVNKEIVRQGCGHARRNCRSTRLPLYYPRIARLSHAR
jgi:hypothetical protein